ncbi:ABC transporter substrate-binding protein [Eisenbergiella tayi]|uniref:ABC transporter substrate-binding protein n=1 Tax=Eisenbergiella tayi TaxID=1432052 RepID=UPI001495B85C|nr:extracellular solute-binding protein [Eisenbergiella tayi]
MDSSEVVTGEGKETIRYMIWGDASLYNQISDSLQTTYPEFFEKYEIEVIVGGSGDNEVAEKIRLSLASGEPCADIIQLNYTQVPEFAEAGALEDLSDVYEGYEDNLTFAAKNLSQYKDQIVTVANQINSKLFYYRKDIFDECGVDPTQWKTVDDMIAGSAQIKEKYPDSFIHNCSKEEGFSGYDAYMMMCVYDAKFSDENGEYICDTDPGLRKSMETLKKIFDSGICYGSGDFTPDWEAALADGTLVGEFTGSWFKLFIPGYAPDQSGKWAACLWPEEIRKGSEAGGSVLVIPVFSEQKEAAKEYLKMYRLQKEGVLAAFENADRTPITQAEFDTIAEKENDYLTNNYWKIESDSYDQNSFTIFNYSPNAVAEMTIFNGWCAKYFSGQADLDETLKGMNDDMKNQIGNALE